MCATCSNRPWFKRLSMFDELFIVRFSPSSHFLLNRSDILLSTSFLNTCTTALSVFAFRNGGPLH
jgi:hypothetical protein